MATNKLKKGVNLLFGGKYRLKVVGKISLPTIKKVGKKVFYLSDEQVEKISSPFAGGEDMFFVTTCKRWRITTQRGSALCNECESIIKASLAKAKARLAELRKNEGKVHILGKALKGKFIPAEDLSQVCRTGREFHDLQAAIRRLGGDVIRKVKTIFKSAYDALFEGCHTFPLASLIAC